MVQRHLLLKYLNREIELETGHGTLYRGRITDLDDWGVHFMPEDKNLKPAIISWNDIRKIIILEESKEEDSILKRRRQLFDETF